MYNIFEQNGSNKLTSYSILLSDGGYNNGSVGFASSTHEDDDFIYMMWQVVIFGYAQIGSVFFSNYLHGK